MNLHGFFSFLREKILSSKSSKTRINNKFVIFYNLLYIYIQEIYSQTIYFLLLI